MSVKACRVPASLPRAMLTVSKIGLGSSLKILGAVAKTIAMNNNKTIPRKELKILSYHKIFGIENMFLLVERQVFYDSNFDLDQ